MKQKYVLALVCVLFIAIAGYLGFRSPAPTPSTSPTTATVAGDSQAASSDTTATVASDSQAVSSDDWKPEILDFKIGSGNQGGSWYVYGGRIAEILNREIPGFRAAVTLGGGLSNTIGLRTKEFGMGFSHAYSNYLTWIARPPITEKYQDVRYVMSLFPAATQLVVRKDSPLEYIHDLKNGKHKISLLPQSSLAPELVRQLFKVMGFSEEDLVSNGSQVSYAAHAVASQGLLDGLFDVIHYLDSTGLAPGRELEQNIGIKSLKLTPEELKAMCDDNPGLIPVELPGGQYSGNPEPTPLMGSVSCLIVHESLSEELVYRITKALCENMAELDEVDKEFSLVVGPDLLKGASVPVHPGAKRYYEEIGITVPEVKIEE